MISFKFLDEVYISSKQNHKMLSIRDLYAKINFKDKLIGEIQCYYLDSQRLFHVNTNFLNSTGDVLTEEEIKFLKDTGITNSDDYEKYLNENFMIQGEYEGFIYDNEIEVIDGFIREDKDVLYIKDLKLNGEFGFIEIIMELKYTLYVMFDYKNYIIMDDEENVVAEVSNKGV